MSVVNLRERTASMAGFFLSESVWPEVPDEALRHCVMAASQARSRVSAREGGRGARSSARCVVPCERADLRMKVRASMARLSLSESIRPEVPDVAV